MRFLHTILPLALSANAIASPEPGKHGNHGPKAKCPDVVKSLKKAVGGDSTLLILPGTEEFQEELFRAYDFGSQEVKPKVIARPKTSKQAAAIVKALVDNDCKFAIMSGGHMREFSYKMILRSSCDANQLMQQSERQTILQMSSSAPAD